MSTHGHPLFCGCIRCAPFEGGRPRLGLQGHNAEIAHAMAQQRAYDPQMGGAQSAAVLQGTIGDPWANRMAQYHAQQLGHLPGPTDVGGRNPEDYGPPTAGPCDIPGCYICKRDR